MVSRLDTSFLPGDLCGGCMAPKPRRCHSNYAASDGGQSLDGVGVFKAVSKCKPQCFRHHTPFLCHVSLFEYPVREC